MTKHIFIFDLDNTIINSEHRTERDSQGKLNLSHWFKNATPENIAKDTLLPLASLFKKAKTKHHLVICTARNLTKADRDFLKNNGLNTSNILSRKKGDMRSDDLLKCSLLSKLFQTKFKGKRAIMFDDNPEVRQAVKKLGIKTVNPIPINEAS